MGFGIIFEFVFKFVGGIEDGFEFEFIDCIEPRFAVEGAGMDIDGFGFEVLGAPALVVIGGNPDIASDAFLCEPPPCAPGTGVVVPDRAGVGEIGGASGVAMSASRSLGFSSVDAAGPGPGPGIAGSVLVVVLGCVKVVVFTVELLLDDIPSPLARDMVPGVGVIGDIIDSASSGCCWVLPLRPGPAPSGDLVLGLVVVGLRGLLAAAVGFGFGFEFGLVEVVVAEELEAEVEVDANGPAVALAPVQTTGLSPPPLPPPVMGLPAAPAPAPMGLAAALELPPPPSTGTTLLFLPLPTGGGFTANSCAPGSGGGKNVDEGDGNGDEVCNDSTARERGVLPFAAQAERNGR